MTQLSPAQLLRASRHTDEEEVFKEKKIVVNIKILPLEQKYVDGGVEMRLMTFRKLFLAQLGQRFLREFYSQAVGHNLAVNMWR